LEDLKVASGKQTPQMLAKEWAKKNPERTVKIDVLSLIPKGRGGRNGLGQRTNTFYAHSGVLRKLEPLRFEPYVGDIYADEDPIKDGRSLPLVIIDLQCKPCEVVEVETSRCFYYRVDGVMTIWQGRQQNRAKQGL
jgi:hypothetical protein